MAKIVWIVGASFSGTSLLNLLLDTQPTIRGLGEGSQVYRRGTWGPQETVHVSGGPCALCRSTVDECQLYRNYTGQPFYRFNLDHYRCNVLIDSSKSVDMFRVKPFEPDHRYLVIMMSKSPPEAVYSFKQHAKWDHWDAESKKYGAVPAGLNFYIRTYRNYLNELSQIATPPPVICVQYAQLVTKPVRAIERLCSILEEPFDDGRLTARWWETDTHILGGNPAVVAQVVQDDQFAFAIPRDRYLDGKYEGRAGQIFYDSAWQRDRTFLEECFGAMNERRSELRALLPRIGHDFEDVMDDLERLRSSTSN